MSDKKRKFSMTGILLVGCMLVCLILALAVVPGGFGSDQKQDLDDENTPGLQAVIEDGSPLLIYDKRPETKALMSDFEEGMVASVNATLGNEGHSVLVDTDEQSEITEIYKALKNVMIGDELGPDDTDPTASTNSPNALGACYISFELSDGSTCDFTFENTEVYDMGDGRYAAAGTEGLWAVIEELGDE
ncbi:MAG: hypothetical protein Q4A65_02780 [Bacillota bacterium]|nr:hypothetical protein [Bacillota bacterium]